MLASIRIVLAVCSLLLFGCRSPQAKLDKLLKDHPELVQVRTLTVTDTVHLPGATVRKTVDVIDDSITVTQVPGVIVTFTGTAKGDLVIDRLPEAIPYSKELSLPTIGVSLAGAAPIAGVIAQPPIKDNSLSAVDKIIIAAALLLILLMFYKKT